MILPFPTRIPVLPAFLLTSLLIIVQLLEKTDPRYSLLTFTFFMLSVFAFNVAGGLSRPSGAYIFAFSLMVVTIGTVTKALLGEPADSNLQSPLLMMSAYCVSIAGMLLAGFFSRRIATTTTGVAGILHIHTFNYSAGALGCLLIYLFLILGGPLLPGGGGQVLHSLQVINPFLPLSILLSTIGAIRESNGQRSTSVLSIITMAFTLYMGTLTFSKQGEFTPVTCWILGVAWGRFRLRLIHFFCLGIFAFVGNSILAPISQAGRDEVVKDTFAERRAIVEHYLTHRDELRERTKPVALEDTDKRMFYYDRQYGLLDRLSMMPNDSTLIDYSATGHYFGYLPIFVSFENWVPHLIAPHKLEGVRVGGNVYMHELGGLAEDDLTTGISFSPTAEAFHIDGWKSLILVAPFMWLVLFVTADATCGDIRQQPLGLLYILIFAHVAPEGGIAGPIDMTRLVNAAFVLALYFCGYVAPVIGMLLQGKSYAQPTFNPVKATQPFMPEALETT